MDSYKLFCHDWFNGTNGDFNDALIMVSHLNALIKERGLHIDTLVTASKDRFRAVLLTTISTMGMIPTIYGFGGNNLS